jgi:hypothetical protein
MNDFPIKVFGKLVNQGKITEWIRKSLYNLTNAHVKQIKIGRPISSHKINKAYQVTEAGSRKRHWVHSRLNFVRALQYTSAKPHLTSLQIYQDSSKIVSFSKAVICHGQNRKFQHV